MLKCEAQIFWKRTLAGHFRGVVSAECPDEVSGQIICCSFEKKFFEERKEFLRTENFFFSHFIFAEYPIQVQ